MSNEFKKVQLNEYEGLLCGDVEDRRVVVVGESEKAAKQQLKNLAAHLTEVEGIKFVVEWKGKLENFHLTYTEDAWKQLRVVE